MSETPTDRNHDRPSLQWKAVVAFNPALGWPVLHTHTLDLSAAGAAISSDYGNLTGANITLILESPPGIDQQTMMFRVPARVTSSVKMPQGDHFRHDLVFVRSPNDRLGMLEKYLNGPAEAPESVAPLMPAAPAAPTPPTSQLDKLKALAQKKLAEQKADVPAPAVSNDNQIDKALRRAYEYFKELIEQLNVVKPDFPRQYGIAGVAEFGNFSWGGGSADGFNARETKTRSNCMERVSVNFVLSGGEPIQLDREYPASDKLKRLFSDYKIEFTTNDVYNARGSLDRVKFEVPRTVEASVQFTAKFDSGKILLTANNIGGFGAMQQMVAPEAITEASLNEFSGFILGETKALRPLLLQGA
jgi:hypothetical protein